MYTTLGILGRKRKGFVCPRFGGASRGSISRHRFANTPKKGASQSGRDIARDKKSGERTLMVPPPPLLSVQRRRKANSCTTKEARNNNNKRVLHKGHKGMMALSACVCVCERERELRERPAASREPLSVHRQSALISPAHQLTPHMNQPQIFNTVPKYASMSSL